MLNCQVAYDAGCQATVAEALYFAPLLISKMPRACQACIHRMAISLPEGFARFILILVFFSWMSTLG
jgi:hypothetical protein